MYKEKTMIAYNNWNAISRMPVNQAVTFIPSPHVSLNISIIQNIHQPITPNSIKFAAFLKLFSLKSMIAMAIRINSIISLIKETGKGKPISLAINIT